MKTMKKRILFWTWLLLVLAVFTAANWVIHGHDRWWFNTLDYTIAIQPEKHPDSIVVGVDFKTDDYHGKGEIEIEEIQLSGKRVEFDPLDARQSTFHMGDRYKLDSLHARVVIPYQKDRLGFPMRIKGGMRYMHSMTKKTDYRRFDIETELEERDNRLVFNRIKYPVK